TPLPLLKHPSPADLFSLSLHDALPICTVLAECLDVVETVRSRVDRALDERRHLDFAMAPQCQRNQHEVEMTPLIERTIYPRTDRSEEHTSELQSLTNLVCRLLPAKNTA